MGSRACVLRLQGPADRHVQVKADGGGMHTPAYYAGAGSSRADASPAERLRGRLSGQLPDTGVCTGRLVSVFCLPPGYDSRQRSDPSLGVAWRAKSVSRPAQFPAPRSRRGQQQPPREPLRPLPRRRRGRRRQRRRPRGTRVVADPADRPGPAFRPRCMTAGFDSEYVVGWGERNDIEVVVDHIPPVELSLPGLGRGGLRSGATNLRLRLRHRPPSKTTSSTTGRSRRGGAGQARGHR